MHALHLTQQTILRLARPLTAPLILLLAALLRFYQLSGPSLWADEGNSVALAQRGFAEIARRTAFDIHPPLYYWLLKIWLSVFGDGEIGLRSLSVLLGIGLVYLTWLLGMRFFSSRVGLTAAFIAALSPLQVYYSQEARMYMLLALLSALTALTALLILQNYLSNKPKKAPVTFIYILTVTAGLYTHYAYPLILLAANLTALIYFWQARQSKIQSNCSATRSEGVCHPLPCIVTIQNPKSKIQNRKSKIKNWAVLQLFPLLLYLPWLPVAWRQISTWPSEKQPGPPLAILNEISTTLLLGLSWPFDLAPVMTIGLGLALLISLWLGLKNDWPNRGYVYPPLVLLWLWFLLPVLLTTIIFSPAFLKFLLVAAPPLALLLSLAIEWLVLKSGHFWAGYSVGSTLGGLTRRRLRPTGHISWPGYLLGGALLAFLSGAALVSLYHYYNDPTYARDNYRGIANFIKAVGGAEDIVILNAEGQQDVFNYYYERDNAPPSAVYPLPRQRPLDEAATLAELQQLTQEANKVYAVYWATRQADPNGLIEAWLDNQLFKAADCWYGNVRLVSYASPLAGPDIDPRPLDYQLGPQIRLTGYALSSTRLRPADILQVALIWETDTPVTENFTVFAQVLDSANHLVGQRDALPLVASPNWPAGEPVADGHGIFIEPGTPPGKHRLIVGLYDGATGQRLPVTAGAESNGEPNRDFIELGQVEIVRPAVPLPLQAFNIQVALNTPMLDVVLLGYDLYKTGHRSRPDTPLHPGDPLHLVAYWTPRRPARQMEDQLFMQVITNNGRPTPLSVIRPPSGIDYAIEEWQPGEIIRAQYDLFLSDLEPGLYRLALTLGDPTTSRPPVTAVTKPFRVE